jgi:periplasmic protein TonB
MENQRALELIKLDVLGNLGEKDAAELLKLMQTQKEFPWKEMGNYQNLAAMFSVTVKQEIPSQRIKEVLLSSLEKKAEKELVIEDETIQIEESKVEETIIAEPIVKVKKTREDSLTFKEPDLSSLNIFNHSKDFEEVKSRVAKIREQIKESTPVEKPVRRFVDQKKDDDIILQVNRPEKHSGSSGNLKKILAIAASLFLVTIIVIGFMYFESSGENIESQTLAAEKENKLLASNNNVNPEEKTGIITAQNVEQINPKLDEQIQADEKPDLVEESVNKPVETNRQKETEKKDRKKVESKEDVVPPLESPKLIEAPLIDQNKSEKKNKTEEQAALIDNNPPPPKEEKKIEEPTYFVAVEEMPEPIGGLKTIQSKITYPELARKAGIEGKVFILAYVDETGKVTRAEVIKGIGLGCDEAALNAVLLTKFKPGKQRGKSIKVQVTIPITFKL